MKCTGFSVLKDIMASLGVRISKDMVTVTKHPCFWIQHFKSDFKAIIGTWNQNMLTSAPIIVQYEELMLNMNKTITNLCKDLNLNSKINPNEITLKCIQYGMRYHDDIVYFSNMENAFVHGIPQNFDDLCSLELMKKLDYPIVKDCDIDTFSSLNNRCLKTLHKNLNHSMWEQFKIKLDRGVKIETIEKIWQTNVLNTFNQSSLNINVFMIVNNCEEELAHVLEMFDVMISVYNFSFYFYILEHDSNDLTDNLIVDWMRNKQGEYKSINNGSYEQTKLNSICKSMCTTWDSEISLILQSDVNCSVDVLVNLLASLRNNVCCGYHNCYVVKNSVFKGASFEKCGNTPDNPFEYLSTFGNVCLLEKHF